MVVCPDCFKKQRRIDELEEQVVRLKVKLKYEERKTKNGYFGSSTPSSKKPFKENTKVEKNEGGAIKGHRGRGRKSFSVEEADIVKCWAVEENKCPDCDVDLILKDIVERSVVDIDSVKAKKILNRSERKECPLCKKTFSKKPVMLPKFLYGNELIAQAITMHYQNGIPVGRIEDIFGNNLVKGSLHNIFHLVAQLWESAMSKLIEEYRKDPAKHADETGWRNNGDSGYSWLFCTEKISIFQFADTRSSRIPRGIFGEKKLPGVLVVDRYGGYNKVPCKIQYCYEHLLRKVTDLGTEFKEEAEVQCFVDKFAPLLAEAMSLRTLPISDEAYYKKARKIKSKILKIINSPSRHPGIKEIQIIFKEKKKRLYHWVKDRRVPADNNRAERDLRPTVIARKVSFGSQSQKGAATRSVLMSILQTAKKRLGNQTVAEWFKEALDKIASNPDIDPFSLLPPPN